LKKGNERFDPRVHGRGIEGVKLAEIAWGTAYPTRSAFPVRGKEEKRAPRPCIVARRNVLGYVT